MFFNELKQTLQLTDFIGTNENAVKWQIWTGLLTHLLLHYLKFFFGWNKAFSRLVGIVHAAVWMDIDIVELLRPYGMAVFLSSIFPLPERSEHLKSFTVFSFRKNGPSQPLSRRHR